MPTQFCQEFYSSDDTVLSLATVVSGKMPTALTNEDFSRAAGIVEVASALAKERAKQPSGTDYTIILPTGENRTIPTAEQPESKESIVADFVQWRDRFGLSAEDAAFFALTTLFPANAYEAKVGEPPTSPGEKGN